MKHLLLLSLNTLSLLGTLFVNYYIGTGAYTGSSIGEISAAYPTLLTPASYAFSIWGLIYLMLIAFVGYQWYGYFKGRNEESLKKAGIWFTLANIANALWVIAWVSEALALSVLIIFLLLFFLLRLVLRLELETWDAPLRIIVFVWWPVTIYFGWIVLATVINVAVWLKELDGLQEILSPQLWALIMLIVSALIYLFLTYERNMREAALVGVWGLIGIAYRQWEHQESVVITALLAAAAVFLYASYHGFKNRESSPFLKLKNKAF